MKPTCLWLHGLPSSFSLALASYSIGPFAKGNFVMAYPQACTWSFHRYSHQAGEFQGSRPQATCQHLRAKASRLHVEQLPCHQATWDQLQAITYWQLCLLPGWRHFHCLRWLELHLDSVFWFGIGRYFPGISPTNTKGKLGWDVLVSYIWREPLFSLKGRLLPPLFDGPSPPFEGKISSRRIYKKEFPQNFTKWSSH